MFTVKTFDELNAGEIYEILKARAAVFVVEQNIVYLDTDDKDSLIPCYRKTAKLKGLAVFNMPFRG